MSVDNPHMNFEEAEEKKEELDSDQRDLFNSYEAAYVEGIRYVRDQAEALERNLEMVDGLEDEVADDLDEDIETLYSDIEEEWDSIKERYLAETDDYQGNVEDIDFEGVWSKVYEDLDVKSKVLKKPEVVKDLSDEILEGAKRENVEDHPISSVKEHLNIIIYGPRSAEGFNAKELDYDPGLMTTGARAELLNRKIVKHVTENEMPDEVVVDPDMPEVPEAPDFTSIPDDRSCDGVPDGLYAFMENFIENRVEEFSKSHEERMKPEDEVAKGCKDSFNNARELLNDKGY
ncbi:MAG: hypothetical protein H8Z69_02910 [Nanohaloarchaea archaeon]|nr:hypothetical protein [Candidatus Nanohaloarchaea archaeon]